MEIETWGREFLQSQVRKIPPDFLSFLIKFHPAVKTPKHKKDFLVLSQSNWGQMLTLLHSSLMLEQGKGKGFGL